MSSKLPSLDKELLRLPSSLTVKDLFQVVSIVVSLTLAWGVFSTRISLVEREIITIQQQIRALDDAVDKLGNRVSRNIAHQQEDELFIDQLYRLLKQPPPTRRAD